MSEMVHYVHEVVVVVVVLLLLLLQSYMGIEFNKIVFSNCKQCSANLKHGRQVFCNSNWVTLYTSLIGSSANSVHDVLTSLLSCPVSLGWYLD